MRLVAILFALAATVLHACPVGEVHLDGKIRVKQECLDNPLARSCMP